MRLVIAQSLTDIPPESAPSVGHPVWQDKPELAINSTLVLEARRTVYGKFWQTLSPAARDGCKEVHPEGSFSKTGFMIKSNVCSLQLSASSEGEA
nr:unnamed protein product [Callosobruchus chinensis]